MTRLDVELQSRRLAKDLLTKEKRVDPMREQLYIAYQAALEALGRLGEATEMVDSITIYFHQSSGVSEPSFLTYCFDVSVAAPGPPMGRFECCAKFEGKGKTFAVGELVRLLVDAVRHEFSRQVQEVERKAQNLDRIRLTITPEST